MLICLQQVGVLRYSNIKFILNKLSSLRRIIANGMNFETTKDHDFPKQIGFS